MIITDEAIVLRTMKYGESSVIATLYTREHGKQSVLAKGARNRSRSRVSALEAMSHVRAVIYTKPNRDLQLLTQCDACGAMKALASDLSMMAAGMTVVELVNLATVPGEVHPELFDLLADALETFQTATPQAENALYFFEVRFLDLLGFRPELGICTVCGGTLRGGPGSGETREYGVTSSGAVCGNCVGRAGDSVSVSVSALRALAGFQTYKNAETACRVVLNADVRREIKGLLRRLLQSHVTGAKPLRSETVFSSIQ